MVTQRFAVLALVLAVGTPTVSAAQGARGAAPLRVGADSGPSRLKPGCAETAIVNGLLGLIDSSRKGE